MINNSITLLFAFGYNMKALGGGAAVYTASLIFLSGFVGRTIGLTSGTFVSAFPSRSQVGTTWFNEI